VKAMRIVLLGPQGAGKGTQAQRISERTGAKHISTGELVRAEIKSGSELGKKIKYFNDRGEPLKHYYAGRGILATVDATQRIAEVTEDVLRAARLRDRLGLEDHDKSREEKKGG
jgi:adenylate kinase family enzyme